MYKRQAIGAAAGEMLDPTKDAKDKKPLTAAALGGLGGAVAGGGIGKASSAINKKLGIDTKVGTVDIKPKVIKKDPMKTDFNTSPNKNIA